MKLSLLKSMDSSRNHRSYQLKHIGHARKDQHLYHTVMCTCNNLLNSSSIQSNRCNSLPCYSGKHKGFRTLRPEPGAETIFFFLLLLIFNLSLISLLTNHTIQIRFPFLSEYSLQKLLLYLQQ